MARGIVHHFYPGWNGFFSAEGSPVSLVPQTARLLDPNSIGNPMTKGLAIVRLLCTYLVKRS